MDFRPLLKAGVITSEQYFALRDAAVMESEQQTADGAGHDPQVLRGTHSGKAITSDRFSSIGKRPRSRRGRRRF